MRRGFLEDAATGPLASEELAEFERQLVESVPILVRTRNTSGAVAALTIIYQWLSGGPRSRALVAYHWSSSDRLQGYDGTPDSYTYDLLEVSRSQGELVLKSLWARQSNAATLYLRPIRAVPVVFEPFWAPAHRLILLAGFHSFSYLGDDGRSWNSYQFSGVVPIDEGGRPAAWKHCAIPGDVNRLEDATPVLVWNTFDLNVFMDPAGNPVVADGNLRPHNDFTVSVWEKRTRHFRTVFRDRDARFLPKEQAWKTDPTRDVVSIQALAVQYAGKLLAYVGSLLRDIQDTIEFELGPPIEVAGGDRVIGKPRRPAKFVLYGRYRVGEDLPW